MPRFFASCDLVKFAKAGSTDAGALAALDAAQAIVLSTAAPLEIAAQSIPGPVRLPRPIEGEDQRWLIAVASGARSAPYLLMLAIALPFAVYYFVQLRGPDIHWRNKGALALLAAAVPLGAVGRLLPRAPPRRHHGVFAHARFAATAQGRSAT